MCPDCAKKNGHDPKSVRDEIDDFLSRSGLGFWCCPLCRSYVFRRGIRGLVAGLEANSVQYLNRVKIQCYKNGVIG